MAISMKIIFKGDSEKYSQFLDEYISWYYEPLIPQYEEAKFSIKYFEDKFEWKMDWNKIGDKKISGIFMKDLK